MVEAIKEKRWRELELSNRDRALCTVAEKLSAQPTRMVPEDWQPLRDLGFDDQACLEVGHIVGGQIAWGDPETGISVGYCTNGFVDWMTLGRRITVVSSLAARCVAA